MTYRDQLAILYGTPCLGTVNLTPAEKRSLWLEERAGMQYLPYGDHHYAYCSQDPDGNEEDMWFDADGNELPSPASFIE
jgi:hypothetical protein